MPFPTRVTGALLRVLGIFVRAFDDEDRDLHGWAIKEEAGLSGAATYKMLDRLEGAGWIEGQWEARNPEPGRPPRRLYRLTATGEPAARALLHQRGHSAVQRPVGGRGLGSAVPGRLRGLFGVSVRPSSSGAR